MTALTKLYNANLDITDANIQDVAGDVTKSTYIRIPVTLPTSGQISLSIGGYNSEVEQPGPYISSATLRALDVLVAGYNRDRSKSVPFTFLNMLFGGNTQVNDVIVWAGRNAANELLLVFEIDNETPTGSGSAASYQDVRNIDPNPLVVNHLTLSPEDSFNLPTTDDSAAIVDTDLMVMLPASDVPGQTRVNPVMQSWADLKSDVGAAGGAQVAANTAAIATNKGASDTNTAAIATNTTNIATNTTAIADLEENAPPGMTADFLITSWRQFDDADGTPENEARWEYENATNEGSLGTQTDRVVDTISRTIERVDWYNDGKIRMYSVDGSDAAWGGGFTANTVLSLYVYTVGLPSSLNPSDDPTLVEYELASGTTGTWGAGGTYVQWTAAIPTGFTDQVDVRFLFANKGENTAVATFLGIRHPAIDTNTAAIAANKSAIATNTASIAALPDFGVDNIVADWTITSWDLQDSADGVAQNSRFYRWNSAPNPTGVIAAGADLTFTPASRALTIGRIQWFPDGHTSVDGYSELRIYATSATDAAWGTEIIGNSELSLYAYLQGLPNAPQRVNEISLSAGQTFNWGTGNAATGVSWDFGRRDSVDWGLAAEATAVRFIIADKGQGARVATWLGIANGIPEIVGYEYGLGSSFFVTATAQRWYESTIEIPGDSPSWQQYEFLLSAGPNPHGSPRVQVASRIMTYNAWSQIPRLPTGVVSGTTEFDTRAHAAMYIPVGHEGGFYVGRANTGDKVWVVPAYLNDNPARLRMVVYRVGSEPKVP